MKRSWFSLLLLGLLCMGPAAWCVDQQAWQIGRIVSVQKMDQTKTLYWMGNTPVTQDETNFLINVHLQDRIYTGSYELGKSTMPAPDAWVKEHPVRVQILGDSMYLRTPEGTELKLMILKRKSAPMMRAITQAELTQLNLEAAPPPSLPSLIGFDTPAEKPQPKPSAPAEAPDAAPAVTAPPPPPPPGGFISVSSTPYLAEVYVDGDSMGYTPAKVRLPPGKHTVRLEKNGYKPWVKEVTLTEGSDLTLDAGMERKEK